MIEGIDYYYTQEGLMVLTEVYLLKKGTCCNNGCRHCPYKDKEEKKEEENLSSTSDQKTNNASC